MPHTRRLNSLRFFVFVLIGVALLAFSILFFSIFHTSMPAMLLQSETRYLERQITVVGGLFDSARDRLLALSEELAVWPEMHEYARGENPDVITRNWPAVSPLQNYDLSFMFIKDMELNDLYAAFWDYRENRPLPVPAGFSEELNRLAKDVLAHYATIDPAQPGDMYSRSGVFFFEDRPYTLAVLPVIPDREATSPSGVFLAGNILDSAYFHEITHYNDNNFALMEAENAGHLSSRPITRMNQDEVFTLVKMEDIDGYPIVLRMGGSRAIFAEGRDILARANLMLVGAMLLFVLLLYQIISRLMIRPVERIGSDIARMDEAAALNPRDYPPAREFAVLCDAVNKTMRRLNQSQVSQGVLQHILNGIDAYIYVSDPVTDEILFINDQMAEHYEIPGQPVGQICWKVLQSGFTRRCDFCPNPRLLQNGDPIVWEEHSTATGHYYRNTDCLIDWLGGRKAHLQHSVDITNIKVAEAALTRRLEQQELMSAMAQNFILPGDMRVLIQSALQLAGEFMGVGKILLARIDYASQTAVFDYSWYNTTQNVQRLSVPSAAFVPGYITYDALIANRAEYIACDTLDDEGDAAAALREAGVLSFLAAPLHVGGEFWGFLAFDEVVAPREWNESDIQLVRLISSVISGVIARNVTEGELERMSSIVNSSPQFIAYINLEGGYDYINQGALDMLGYTEQEMRAGGLAAMFDEASMDMIRQSVLPAVLQKSKHVFELPIRRKDGGIRIMNISAFKTGFREVGIGVIASDITEKRELEAQLIAAKDLAEQSSSAKSEFLSRMSHEMRTPMNAIIGMTSIAKGSPDLEKKEYCLDKIDDASKHLLGVINDILDMSKIEANKFELSVAEFNVEKMLMRVINVINFRVEEKKQTFTLHMDSAVPHFLVSDEQRLAQVITNLLSNAVKFTPERGAISLTVAKEREEGGVCTLRFEVSDTGIGISPEQQSKLFRSFEQADGSISRKFGGTGLGLAISKRIIEMMDGAVWIESEEGRGSTFLFTIQARRGTRTRKSLCNPMIPWEKLRVLAVDDAPEVREYFEEVARSMGFICETAESGFAACERLDRDDEPPFQIIFVDWKMPGMDGIELTRRIKAKFGEHIVVIMISATEWHEIEPSAKGAGVDRFVPKPLFASLIVDCINESLGVGACGAPEEISGEQPLTGCFAGYRVLLAEDVDINREIAQALLEDTGLVLEEAENGLEAVRKFQANPARYDLILMDIHMPEVDGYEATRRIRDSDIPEARLVPIVAMTANVFREDIERCLAAGMNDHIGKPINLDELLEKLRANLPARPASLRRAAG